MTEETSVHLGAEEGQARRIVNETGEAALRRVRFSDQGRVSFTVVPGGRFDLCPGTGDVEVRLTSATGGA